ncbi:MAG: ABC transporter substrate-binding protein [bacterium]|nr:ABC transporter substrate-binding protein [bacterium]
MRQLKFSAKLPNKSEIESVWSSFSKKEWLVFIALVLTLLGSTVAILESVNKHFMIRIPMRGGVLSEGIVGTPRFVNPVLAFSDPDRDLVSLVYSGLMRKNENGVLIPDLAEKYEVGNKGLSYTFTLRDKIYFHDNTPVTADDIIFTIDKVKDPVLKSPRKGNWDGISVAKIDNKTIVFTLQQPYTSFLENATLGIIPMHLWNNSPIELNEANINPVGSGPYVVKNVSKESSGTINYYKLEAFNKFNLNKPYIKSLLVRFYQNESDLISALTEGEVEQVSSITPANALSLKEKGYRIESSTLPRIFGLFFNQSQNQVFLDKVVVRAIDQVIDKDRIISEVLFGYGVAIDDPIPPNMIGYQKLKEGSNVVRKEVLEKVKNDLAKDGWLIGVSGFLEKTFTENKKKVVKILEFSISTGNAPELAKSASLIQEDLRAVGMKVEIKTFDVGNLNQSVIRPRKYDALLFGQIINNEGDLFAFWHSSQRKDPGLNVAMYTNTKVDKILEDAFITTDSNERVKKYAQFEDEIGKDMPAVFLYSPNFIYVVSKDVEGLQIDHVVSPSARFINSYLWYINTDNVWKIFSK